ncbi:nucleolin [Drosophila tropicalis]|uniref:nucleolin n=1 Tax=Drosophila tropicalis TaxID=46794 RepID=UPI0035ABC17D
MKKKVNEKVTKVEKKQPQEELEEYEGELEDEETEEELEDEENGEEVEDEENGDELEDEENGEELEDEDDLDLAASSTDSDTDEDEADTDDDDDDDDDENQEISKPKAKTKAEIINEQIHNKYDQLKGTRLFLRFPKKLPLDETEFVKKVKSLHKLIAKPIKPRQKHARFCLVDFKSQEDRDAALADIKADIAKGNDDFKGIFVSLPKTESQEFVNDLVARKTLSLENKKTKSLMKRAAKKVEKGGKDNFTSTLVICNLPKTSSVAQVRQLFENAVDIQIKPGKGKFRDFNAASVTMPTTYDARKVIKQSFSLGGTKLLLRFNNRKNSSKNKKIKNKKAQNQKRQLADNGEVPAKKLKQIV